MNTKRWAAGILCLVMSGGLTIGAPRRYVVTDLGTVLGDRHGDALSINNRGQIVGESWLDPNGHAVLWENGEARDISHPDFNRPGYHSSGATSINNRGEVVGASASASVDSPQVGSWVFMDGDYTLYPPGVRLTLINERGQILGQSILADWPSYFVLDKGLAKDIGTMPDGRFFLPEALNDHGDVAGICVNTDFSGAPCVWRNGSVTELESLPGDAGEGVSDINNRGQVVGTAFTGNRNERFGIVWDHGVPTMLPMPPGAQVSTAVAINDRGEIVGVWAESDLASEYHPVVWVEGQYVELPLPPGADSGDVRDINNRGEIVGSIIVGDTRHPVLWSPREPEQE